MIDVLDPVHGNDSVGRLIIINQAAKGNHRIIDGFGTLLANLIAFFTAIAVNTVTDAVEEIAGFAVDVHRGQAAQVFVDLDRALFLALIRYVVPEIVAAPGGIIINILADHNARRVVDEAVQRAVPAGNQHPIGLGDRRKKGRIIPNIRHAGVGELIPRQDRIQRARFVCAVSTLGVRVEQNLIIHGCASLLKNFFFTPKTA